MKRINATNHTEIEKPMKIEKLGAKKEATKAAIIAKMPIPTLIMTQNRGR
jgi:hypothetical protein